MLLVLLAIALVVAFLYYKSSIESSERKQASSVAPVVKQSETVPQQTEDVGAGAPPVVKQSETVPEPAPLLPADTKTSQTPTALNATNSELQVAADIQERVESNSKQSAVVSVGIPEAVKEVTPPSNEPEAKNDPKCDPPSEGKKAQKKKHKHKHSKRNSSKKSKKSSKKSKMDNPVPVAEN